ncbi:MAG: hypothetical protein JKY09_05085 [Crocinitomicaceae bacterium]|nr:hypothetical protein [Crocinitomicaceae bacterium]
MPKILILLLLSVLVLSCKQEPKTVDTNLSDSTELENRIAQLELDNALKDSVINESLAFFNEIQSNLESIGIRKDQIRVMSKNPELSSDDKTWILEEIRHINFLREDNARKVRQLNGELKKNGLKIKELEIMIESLVKDIQWKDEQINLLQGELENLDREYSALFDAYQEQAIQVDALTEEMNRVYYAYGSERELRENDIIEKKNGFIGLGKKAQLKDGFNDQYFTAINITKVNSINILGSKLRFITDHPTASYELVKNSARTTIKILDASEFWKVSKYLVVIID